MLLVDSQVRCVPRCTHICHFLATSAEQDAFSLGHPHDFPRSGPPIPLRLRTTLRGATSHQLIWRLSAQSSTVPNLEHRAVPERGPHKGMFERERQARKGERERDDVCGEIGRLGMCETSEREGWLGCGEEREDVESVEEGRVVRCLVKFGLGEIGRSEWETYETEAFLAIRVEDDGESFEVYDAWTRFELLEERIQIVLVFLWVDSGLNNLVKRYSCVSY